MNPINWLLNPKCMLKNKNMIDLLPPFEANSISIGLGFVVGNMI
jgi:hypothetical protein